MPIGTGIQLSILHVILALFMSFTATAGKDIPPVVLKSELIWKESFPWFGGLSGAEISGDGKRLIVITDRGRILEAEIIRAAGKITSLRINHAVALRDANGKTLIKPFTDAEGLAIGASGDIFVSFEGQHRVARLDIANGVTYPTAVASDFASFIENSGLEALATNPDGKLFAIPEGSQTAAFPIYVYDGADWTVGAHLPKRGPFVPVGADFDAKGLLYLLERAVTPLGFRSRIRRFDLSKADLAEKTLLKTFPARFDNLESITVWQDSEGRTTLTLISDDNFLPIQETQILEFIVTE